MIDLILDYALKFAGLWVVCFSIKHIFTKRVKNFHFHIGLVDIDINCSFYKD
nr:MAG TPA: hypothetical protein [Caudoviricetes sp.]